MTAAQLANTPTQGRGVFTTVITYGMRDILDGTSNTVFLSERIRPVSNTSLGMVSNNTAASPAACLAPWPRSGLTPTRE